MNMGIKIFNNMVKIRALIVSNNKDLKRFR